MTWSGMFIKISQSRHLASPGEVLDKANNFLKHSFNLNLK